MNMEYKESSGDYPYYNALWHLQSIGVLELTTHKSDAWDLAETTNQESTVALIDVSVAVNHPNLKESIDTERTIDFFSAPLGALPYRAKSTAQTNQPPQQDIGFSSVDLPNEEYTSKLAVETGIETKRLYDNLLSRLKAPSAAQSSIQAASSEAFSAHGTAMAGLIAAKPADVPFMAPKFIEPISNKAKKALNATAAALPYAGVNPYCRLIPISTSLEPDPEQLLLSFMYASLVGADVIVVPREIYDPNRSPVSLSYTSKVAVKEEVDLVESIARSSLQHTDHLWDELADLIVNLSKQIPILCAAGNGGDERLVYPASLAAEDNGVIPVGAKTASGKLSAYSSLTALDAVYAPSGDGERLDQDLQRLDIITTDFDRKLHSSTYSGHLAIDGPGDPATSSNGAFTVQNLISTDVPGDYGYNGSDVVENSDSETVSSFGSFFCEFSGTSGAVAIAGGFLSLAYLTGKLGQTDGTTGVDAKRFLKRASTEEDPQKQYQAVVNWSRIA